MPFFDLILYWIVKFFTEDLSKPKQSERRPTDEGDEYLYMGESLHDDDFDQDPDW